MAIPRTSEEIVNRAALKAAGLGVPGSFFPPLDIAGMAVIWVGLICDLAKASGHKVNWILASKFVLSVTSGAALYVGGSKLLNSLLHAIPGAGTVTAAGTNAVFNWIYTLRLGKLLANQFNTPNFSSGTLLVSASGIASMVLAIPTPDELAEAYTTLGEMLGLSGHETAFAGDGSFGADVASHNDYTATGHSWSGAGNSSLRFRGTDPVLLNINSMPSVETHALLEKALAYAQAHNASPEVLQGIREALASGTPAQEQDAIVNFSKRMGQRALVAISEPTFSGRR